MSLPDDTFYGYGAGTFEGFSTSFVALPGHPYIGCRRRGEPGFVVERNPS